MASAAVRKQDNLTRLTRELKDHAASLSVAIGPKPLASQLSKDLFLTHSTSERNFAAICESNAIVPQAARALAEGWALRPDCAEIVLGTSGCTFFYAAPFRLARTTCGFVFSPTLEFEHVDSGSATPFDSGGLVKPHTVRADAAEPVEQFFARHEVPLDTHREYLGMSMSCLFDEPKDYVEGKPPCHSSPIGLKGGDQRGWTHEVRFETDIAIRGTGHLKALFAPEFLFADVRVEPLWAWCETNRVETFPLEIPQGGNFEVLQAACLNYFRRELYSGLW